MHAPHNMTNAEIMKEAFLGTDSSPLAIELAHRLAQSQEHEIELEKHIGEKEANLEDLMESISEFKDLLTAVNGKLGQLEMEIRNV